jgi:hypothetical protein
VTLGTLTVTKLCLGLTDERTGKRYKSLIWRYDNLALTAYEPGGRGFKSCQARQILQRVAAMQPVFVCACVARM